MVRVSRTYECETCSKVHFSYEEAKACESDHVVDAAVQAFRRDLDKIFAKRSKQAKAKCPPNHPLYGT